MAPWPARRPLVRGVGLVYPLVHRLPGRITEAADDLGNRTFAFLKIPECCFPLVFRCGLLTGPKRSNFLSAPPYP